MWRTGPIRASNALPATATTFPASPMPSGSLPCDINYLDHQYSVVPALEGPDKKKGAPIYVLENDKLVSTIMIKEDLGLPNFTHIHNAAIRKIGTKFYIMALAWNPGDFAILEQA